MAAFLKYSFVQVYLIRTNILCLNIGTQGIKSSIERKAQGAVSNNIPRLVFSLCLLSSLVIFILQDLVSNPDCPRTNSNSNLTIIVQARLSFHNGVLNYVNI